MALKGLAAAPERTRLRLQQSNCSHGGADEGAIRASTWESERKGERGEGRMRGKNRTTEQLQSVEEESWPDREVRGHV